MTRQERLRLNDLSRQAFGTSSKWQKMLKGQLSLLVQQDEEGNERPALRNGSMVWSVDSPHPQDLIDYMNNIIAARNKE